MILAIDTATEIAGLALVSADGLLAEEIWHAGRNHTVELSPRLDALLKRTIIRPAELSGIAVCVGPGSYTGVRIGVAVAKGLALPQSIPVISVSSLEITAFPFRHDCLPVAAVVRAGRKRLIVAHYGRKAEQWGEIVTPRIVAAAELAASLAEPTRVVGEISTTEANIIRTESNGFGQPVGVAQRVRRPSVLAQLGMQKLSENVSASLVDLQPIYMKKPGE